MSVTSWTITQINSESGRMGAGKTKLGVRYFNVLYNLYIEYNCSSSILIL